MEAIAEFIAKALENRQNTEALAKIREQVHALCKNFPLYAERLAGH